MWEECSGESFTVRILGIGSTEKFPLFIYILIVLIAEFLRAVRTSIDGDGNRDENNLGRFYLSDEENADGTILKLPKRHGFL
jgi:hypothetical protein